MFRESLRQHPHSVWALFGLKEAQRAKGDEAAAAAANARHHLGR